MTEAISVTCPNCRIIRQGSPVHAEWCPDCDELMRPVDGPFRDGNIHVLDGKCSTCIFRPGNLMHLSEGFVEKMVDDALADNTIIVCHQTLDGPRSVCRGFYDRHKADVMPLRLATAMDTLVFDLRPEEDA